MGRLPSAQHKTEQQPGRLAHKTLAENVALNMLMSALGYLFSAVTVMYSSRVLQPDIYGRVSFASTMVGYFAMLASLGMPIYAMRFPQNFHQFSVAHSARRCAIILLR